MAFSIVTWNINSVRLRMPIVQHLLELWQPDVLCLQETKCPNDQFPTAPLKKLGYDHIAMHGQKGYHGVATISKHPFVEEPEWLEFCEMGDTRHISTRHSIPGVSDPVLLHNFYVPAGGDEPDVIKNPKFDHKLNFLDEMVGHFGKKFKGDKNIVVGDLNIAPSENDVWSHKQLLKVVSHTPIEVDALAKVFDSGNFVDLVRQHFPEPELLYSWWSYRSKDWASSNRGRRLDHIWSHPDVAQQLSSVDILSEARGWEKPSDHVPIRAVFG
ncbi:MAG: exodeoxyribonuclease III [Paracoccaceae bacterium]